MFNQYKSNGSGNVPQSIGNQPFPGSTSIPNQPAHPPTPAHYPQGNTNFPQPSHSVLQHIVHGSNHRPK